MKFYIDTANVNEMLHHPLTDAGIEKFKADYTKVFGN